MVEDVLHRSVDTVIVGGGMAGLALAADLGEAGDGTIVLEAGPDAGPEHNRWALDGADATRRWLDPELDPFSWRPWTTQGSAFKFLLDVDQQFHGIHGLYAAGPSTFPRTGAENPTLTTLALARRLAFQLCSDRSPVRGGNVVR